MKIRIHKAFSLFIVIMLTVLISCKEKMKTASENTEKQQIVYTCSMHPEIVRNKPGDCPICGMHLVKKVNDQTASVNIDLNTLIKPTNTFVVSSIPIITPEKGEEQIEINALGVVAYDTKEVSTIAARISGRIEKLYVHYRFQPVKKGQKIMEVYSPELLTAQQNLLFLITNDPSNHTFIQSAREKLLLLGMDESQLAQVIKEQRPSYTIAVYSNVSGHIHEAGNSTMNPPAGTMKDIANLTEELPLKEGMYIQKGQTIFTVFDPVKVWALLNIYAADQALIKTGNPVYITPEIDPGKGFDAKINFIEPFFRNNSKTVTARVYFNNALQQIPVGSQVKAVIKGNSKNAWWLPSTAVVSLGLAQVVFIKQEGGFKAKKIQTGMHYKDKIQVVQNLSETDTLARDAQFLMDSESFIKIKN